MLLQIEKVLEAAELRAARELLMGATWGDGRITAGMQSAQAKNNEQLPHRVEPVTRGWRLASFFWIESMVRSDEQRRLLFEMDRHLMRLRSTHGESDPALIGLTGTYHNLLRMWADS